MRACRKSRSVSEPQATPLVFEEPFDCIRNMASVLHVYESSVTVAPVLHRWMQAVCPQITFAGRNAPAPQPKFNKDY